jgi:hypothetical protein
MMRRSGRGEESGNTPRQEKRCQPRFFTQKTQLPPAFLRSWKDAVVTGVFRDLKRHRSVLSFGKFCQPRSKGSRFDTGSCPGALRLHPARGRVQCCPGCRPADAPDSMSPVAGMSVPERPTDVVGVHHGRLSRYGMSVSTGCRLAIVSVYNSGMNSCRMNEAEDSRMADLARYILRLFAATFLPVLVLCLLTSGKHRKTPKLRHFSGR